MASRYLVATGNYNSTDVWSATSGGEAGASVPGGGDDVFLNAASGASVLTVNVASAAKTFIHTGFTGELAGSAGLTVSGNVTFASGATYSYTGEITVNATAAVNMASKVLACALKAIGNGITVTLSNSGTFAYINPDNSSGALTLKVTAGNTLTLTDENPIRAIGTSGNLITMQSVTASSKTTLNCTHASGLSLCDYLVLRDIYITGTARVYPGKNTTSMSNSFGWQVNCVHPTAMTANNAPSPLVASASSTFSDRYAWKSFSKDSGGAGTYWVSGARDLDEWLQLDPGSAKWIGEYRITAKNPADGTPLSWELYSSLDGINYTLIDTQTGVSSWAATETRRYTLSSPVYGRYFKLLVPNEQWQSHAAYNYCAVGELEFISSLENEYYMKDTDSTENAYCPANLTGDIYNDVMTFNGTAIQAYHDNVEKQLAVNGTITGSAGTTTASRIGQKEAGKNLDGRYNFIGVVSKALSTIEKTKFQNYLSAAKTEAGYVPSP